MCVKLGTTGFFGLPSLGWRDIRNIIGNYFLIFWVPMWQKVETLRKCIVFLHSWKRWMQIMKDTFQKYSAFAVLANWKSFCLIFNNWHELDLAFWCNTNVMLAFSMKQSLWPYVWLRASPVLKFEVRSWLWLYYLYWLYIWSGICHQQVSFFNRKSHIEALWFITSIYACNDDYIIGTTTLSYCSNGLYMSSKSLFIYDLCKLYRLC